MIPSTALQGLASALTRAPVFPALHVVAAILLAALMGSFNTQTYLDLNMQCVAWLQPLLQISSPMLADIIVQSVL